MYENCDNHEPSIRTKYVYDGEGNRVAKVAISNMNACPAAQGFNSFTAAYLLGPGGEQVTELNGSGGWLHSNVFGGGRLLGTYDNSGLHFHFADWQGTRRAQTTSSGVREEQCQSLPFGDGLNCSGSGADATEHHFTGRERDTESGNDFLLARYYNSTTGRFLTPDWSLKAEPVPYARLDNPQTLNLYAYVGNNPLTHTDVDGHQAAPADTSDPKCNPTGGGKCPNQVTADKIEASSAANAQAAQQNAAINQTATVVYHEVGGLVPKPGETTSDDLHKVRVDEATVYNHHPKAYPASDLSPVSKSDMKTAAWKDSVAAAREALGKPDIGQHLILYDPAINFPHVPWMQNAYVLPSHAYGGFINAAGGGDIPKGDVVNPLVMQDLTYKEIIWKRE